MNNSPKSRYATKKWAKSLLRKSLVYVISKGRKRLADPRRARPIEERQKEGNVPRENDPYFTDGVRSAETPRRIRVGGWFEYLR